MRSEDLFVSKKPAGWGEFVMLVTRLYSSLKVESRHVGRQLVTPHLYQVGRGMGVA